MSFMTLGGNHNLKININAQQKIRKKAITKHVIALKMS